MDAGSGYVNDLKNSYTFDNLNRLTRLDQSGVTGGNAVAEKRVDFAYNSAGQFTSIDRYKDLDGGSSNLVVETDFTYDGIGRLTDLAHTHDTTTIADYGWTYDAFSRVTQLSFSSLVGNDGTSDYAYDNTGQLTDVDHDFQTDESYSFDENGNRTNTGYTTGTNNRLTSDGTFNYVYDDEGNRGKAASHWLRSPDNCTVVADVLGSLSQWHLRGKAASHWLRSPYNCTVVADVLGSLSQWHLRGKAASHWLRSPYNCTVVADVLGSLSQWHLRGKAASHWLRSPDNCTVVADVLGSLSQWHGAVSESVSVGSGVDHLDVVLAVHVQEERDPDELAAVDGLPVQGAGIGVDFDRQFRAAGQGVEDARFRLHPLDAIGGQAVLAVLAPQFLAGGAVFVLHAHHVHGVHVRKHGVQVAGLLVVDVVLVQILDQSPFHLQFVWRDEELVDVRIEGEQVREAVGGAGSLQVSNDGDRERTALRVVDVEMGDERKEVQQGLRRMLFGPAAAIHDPCLVSSNHHLEREALDERMITLADDDGIGKFGEREQRVDFRFTLVER